MSDHPEAKVNPIKSFISGGFGGICNVLSGHPLDTIKVRLQTMPRPEAGAEPLYKGTMDCAIKTIKHEGFLGLYKGIQAPLTGVVPIFAACFGAYGLATRLQQTENQTKLNYAQVSVAGSFSGVCSTVITAPGERIKCLLQIQMDDKGPKKYDGMLDCAKKLYKEGGIRSIYKGSCATLLRDVPANGMYFFVYEYLQDMAKKKAGAEKLGPASAIFAGGMAGMSYWILGMPADVLKSRLQTAPEGTYKRGIRSAFVDLMKRDGPLALYRGVVPVMLRAFPANGACFFGIDICNNFMTKMGF